MRQIKAMTHRWASRSAPAKLLSVPDASELLRKALLDLAIVEARLEAAQRQHDSVKKTNEQLSQALAKAEKQGAAAQHHAHHDGLTGLPNRLLLTQRLQQGIAEASARQGLLALLFIDVNGFKRVNDQFGHASGDKLLTLVATRLSACIKVGDFASRYGGDEFVVILPNIKSAAAASVLAEQICKHISGRYQIEGCNPQITASIGMATYPGDGEDWDALLSCADAHMYASKSARRRRDETQGNDSSVVRA